MKIRLLTAVLAALLTAVPFAFAGDDEPEIHHKMKIKLAQADDMIDVELDDLAVGESRQFLSESGKEVVVTRTEKGLEVKVDGETIDVLTHDPEHLAVLAGGEGHRVVRVEKRIIGEGDEKDINVFVTAGDDEDGEGHHAMVWHTDDGETMEIDDDAHVMVLHTSSVADELTESGVLDDLSEEKRQEILDAIKKAEGGDHECMHEKDCMHKKVKVIVKSSEEKED